MPGRNCTVNHVNRQEKDTVYAETERCGHSSVTCANMCHNPRHEVLLSAKAFMAAADKTLRSWLNVWGSHNVILDSWWLWHMHVAGLGAFVFRHIGTTATSITVTSSSRTSLTSSGLFSSTGNWWFSGWCGWSDRKLLHSSWSSAGGRGAGAWASEEGRWRGQNESNERWQRIQMECATQRRVLLVGVVGAVEGKSGDVKRGNVNKESAGESEIAWKEERNFSIRVTQTMKTPISTDYNGLTPGGRRSFSRFHVFSFLCTNYKLQR